MLSQTFPNGQFFCGDARELIRSVSNETIDLILTDPPFGLDMDEYDNGELLFEMEPELWRVLKPDGWLVLYWSTKFLPRIFRLKQFEYTWQMICHFGHTYSKWTGGDRAYMPIMIFKKGQPKVKYRRGDVIPSEELPFVIEKVRNAQFKPTITTSMLLQMFSSTKELILDPFAGFGSIPFVCEYFDRNWIAYEIDNKKYDIAIKFITDKKVSRIVI